MGSQITVEVTREDIAEGIRKESSRCVVATAIARTFPNAARIVVDVHAVRFTDGDRRYTYLTPPKVQDYIVAFDAGDQLFPFKFRLRADQRLVQLRSRKTDAGKAIDVAKNATARRRATLRKLTDAGAADTDPLRYALAAEELAEAEAHERVVVARHAGEQQTKVETVQPAPGEQVRPIHSGRSTVFRKNARHYGGRVMRVNDPDDTPGVYRGPLDTE